MKAPVRIKRHLDSETLHLPEIRELVGHDVEIVVSEVEPEAVSKERYPLRGSVLRYDEPFEPVAKADD
jgi:hypothetical protein